MHLTSFADTNSWSVIQTRQISLWEFHSFFFYGAVALIGPGPPHNRGLKTYSDTPRSIELFWMGDQVRRRDYCLTTHNTHKRQTIVPPAGFEPTIPAFELPQTHALDLTVTAICIEVSLPNKIRSFFLASLKLPCHWMRVACDTSRFNMIDVYLSAKLDGVMSQNTVLSIPRGEYQISVTCRYQFSLYA